MSATNLANLANRGCDVRKEVLAAAMGKVARLAPGAPKLSLFVLCGEHVALAPGEALADAGILLLTEATEVELLNLESTGGRQAVDGRVVTLSGRVTGTGITVAREDLRDLTSGQVDVLSRLDPNVRGSSGISMLEFFRSAQDDSLSDLADAIEKTRWTSSVWIERDRANLSLTDELTGREVFSLWDDDFHQALEDGFLCKPRGPRPRDADWHQPALDYAESTGLMADLKLEPQTQAAQAGLAATPAAVARTRSLDRPRG